MDTDKTLLGERIKEIRVKRKETLDQFAKKIRLKTDNKIKTTKSNVSKWEKGENIPNDVTLQAIADLGKTTVDELLDGNPLSKFSDEQLIEELRSRGHEDIAKNTQD